MLGKRSAQLGLFEADKKIDWDDTQQKDELLQSIVADADRLSELAREKLSMCSQARYFGRIKTLFQLLMAATVANLTLVAAKTGLMRDRSRTRIRPLFFCLADYRCCPRLLPSVSRASSTKNATFRLGF